METKNLGIVISDYYSPNIPENAEIIPIPSQWDNHYHFKGNEIAFLVDADNMEVVSLFNFGNSGDYTRCLTYLASKKMSLKVNGCSYVGRTEITEAHLQGIDFQIECIFDLENQKEIPGYAKTRQLEILFELYSYFRGKGKNKEEAMIKASSIITSVSTELSLTLKISGNDEILAEKYGGKLSKNSTLFVLKSETGGIHKIMPELKENKTLKICINVEECGGGMTNTGYSTIVCGMSGKKLRPYRIPKLYSNSVHAYFSVPSQVITIDASKKDSEITIYHHQVLSDEDIVYLEKKVVWEGHYKDLPKKYEKYLTAVNAAVKKANCYHCRCVHYILEADS